MLQKDLTTKTIRIVPEMVQEDENISEYPIFTIAGLDFSGVSFEDIGRRYVDDVLSYLVSVGNKRDITVDEINRAKASAAYRI